MDESWRLLEYERYAFESLGAIIPNKQKAMDANGYDQWIRHKNKD